MGAIGIYLTTSQVNFSSHLTIENENVTMTQKSEKNMQEDTSKESVADENVIEPDTQVEEEPLAKRDNTLVKEEVPTPKGNSGIVIIEKPIAKGFSTSGRKTIDTIIIHSANAKGSPDPYNIDALIDLFESYGVSSHYVIGRDGTIYNLVSEKFVSWHAGVGIVPDGRTDINNFSIGIEMMNTEEGKFTDAQYSALNGLMRDIKNRYKITYIFGHSDIAKGRKTDPWNINWDRVEK